MEPEILLKRINSFTPEYTEFILSDFTEAAVRSVQLSGYNNIDPVVLENGIFLYLTLFFHKFSLIEFIIIECHTSIEDAKNITNIVIDMMPIEMTEMQTEASLALDITDELVREKDRFTIINGSEVLLDQYLYLKTNDFTTKLAEKYMGTNDELIDQFKLVISDIVLGFYKKEDTVPLLQQELGLDPKNAALLGAEVFDLFAIISTSTWNPPSTPNSISVTPQVTASAILPELRTMAADMAEERSPVRSTFNAATTIDEPVYVSTQPVIEKKAPEAPSYAAPLYQPPKPNVDAPLEKPRWG
jgi:hypothetical protein